MASILNAVLRFGRRRHPDQQTNETSENEGTCVDDSSTVIGADVQTITEFAGPPTGDGMEPVVSENFPRLILHDYDVIEIKEGPTQKSKLSKKLSSGDSFKRKITETLHYIDVNQCQPDICVELLKMPSIQLLAGLKKKLRNTAREWADAFLDHGGLDALLDCIDVLGCKRLNQLSDALLVLECMACIKVIMNSKQGLEYLSENEEYTRKLTKGKII